MQTILQHFKSEKKLKLHGELLEILTEESLSAKTLLPNLSKLPPIEKIEDFFNFSAEAIYNMGEKSKQYIGYFHEYLLRGGFPQTVKVDNIAYAQKLLREDIIDKVLKRDMTALFGVRHVLDLEKLFLYLCMHDGGILDIAALCSNLALNRHTVQNFIELLEATHLIYKLLPFSGGKSVLRAKYKIYLADAAIAPAVLLKNKDILNDSNALGKLIETAVLKHLQVYSAAQNGRLTYWQNAAQKETDIVVEQGAKVIPFEIKYRSHSVKQHELKGFLDFCKKNKIEEAFVITKLLNDFGPIENPFNTKIMRIPAALFCCWLGMMEEITP